MFASKLNTMTGKMDWEILDEKYDYKQELARAGFADMLHDYERNQKYYEGLKKVISKLKSENKAVHVLDIGTGTGLLSMMAVKCGADKVTACEAFKPMAAVARKCIAANGMSNKITVIEKHSTDLKVGKDMSERANVLVAEVFDTELIGEGAISTFNHALKNLMVSEDFYVVPDNAIMYVQIVESDICQKWNWLDLEGSTQLQIPESFRTLAGDAILDLQMTQFEDFEPITPPLEAFRFSFSGKEVLKFSNKNIIKTKSNINGTGHAVFVWWVLGMDYESEIILSCAPKWAHHTPDNMQWRDHWMQAIYFPKKPISLKKDEEFLVKCCHDEYSLWFDTCSLGGIAQNGSSSKDYSTYFPDSDDLPLSAATIVSRNRLSQLNDTKRNAMLLKLLSEHSNQDKSILLVNDDFSVLGLMAAKRLSFSKIYVIEPNFTRRNCLINFIELNGLNDRVKLIEKNLTDFEPRDLEGIDFDIIFSEVAFSSGLLPWDNIYFYYAIEHLRQVMERRKVEGHISKDVGRIEVLPKKLKVKLIAIQMENLHKIRNPVGDFDGIKLEEFDEIILMASDDADAFAEPHALWEYPAKPISNEQELLSFEFDQSSSETKEETLISRKVSFKPAFEGVLNGFALWHTIEFDDKGESQINTGLLKSPEANKDLVWNRDYKQSIHILNKKYPITSQNSSNYTITCQLNFNKKEGQFKCSFDVSEKN